MHTFILRIYICGIQLQEQRYHISGIAVPVYWNSGAILAGIFTYSQEMADKIHQRIDEIGAADSVEMMIQFHIGRCHPLKQNRKGQYAMDLVHPYRLVFEKNGDEIQIANILEIVDYH